MGVIDAVGAALPVVGVPVVGVAAIGVAVAGAELDAVGCDADVVGAVEADEECVAVHPVTATAATIEKGAIARTRAIDAPGFLERSLVLAFLGDKEQPIQDPDRSAPDTLPVHGTGAPRDSHSRGAHRDVRNNRRVSAEVCRP
jgi:hypothetical protein